uniref:CW domain-containing protein n=1 Tax=Caenorhabditis tropicalis TaxID=1561998 RepID=A0A1I7ULN0_9PELO
MLIWILILIPLWKAYASDNTKILEVYGQPTVFTNYEVIEGTWSTCQVICMNDVSCVMIYEISESSCYLFRFGEVSLIERMYSGNKIAFKIEFSEDVCPDSNPIISSTNTSNYRITDGLLYTTTFSFDSESWNLEYSITSCPENTTVFLRDTIAVCIGLFYFPSPNLCNNQPKASALCKENNGTLTGPANSNEYAYIQAQSQASYNTSNPGKYKYLTYWIDGVGLSGKYNYAFEDPTHNGISNYVWAENCPLYQSAGYCLYNPNALGYYISDIE